MDMPPEEQYQNKKDQLPLLPGSICWGRSPASWWLTELQVYTDIPEESKHSIIQPRKSHVTTLIIHYTRKQLGHTECPQELLSDCLMARSFQFRSFHGTDRSFHDKSDRSTIQSDCSTIQSDCSTIQSDRSTHKKSRKHSYLMKNDNVYCISIYGMSLFNCFTIFLDCIQTYFFKKLLSYKTALVFVFEF